MNTRKSALFNLKKYRRAIPPAWSIRNIGDHYYLLAFRFLEYVCAEAPASRRRLFLRVFPSDLLDSLAASFLDTLDFSDQLYRRDSYKTYLSLLLLRERTQFEADIFDESYWRDYAKFYISLLAGKKRTP